MFSVFIAQVATGAMLTASLTRPIVPIVPPNPSGPIIIPSTKISRAPRLFKSVPTNGRKVVAITFDDGPTSTNTANFCSTLNRYGAKATFFMVGRRLSAIQTQAAEAEKCGEIGNHSWEHLTMSRIGDDKQRDQIVLTDEIVKKLIGKNPIWFRPKGGIYNEMTKLLMFKTGHKMVLWDVEGSDGLGINLPASEIANNVLKDTKPGSIIMLHQTNPETLKALPTILSTLKARGYRVTTVTELVNNSTW